jgi:copper chaperone
MKTDILKVNGMSCGHCENAIVHALKKLDGVSSVTANAKNGMVSVTYDDSIIKTDLIIETIDDQGFDVTE